MGVGQSAKGAGQTAREQRDKAGQDYGPLGTTVFELIGSLTIPS